MFGAGWISKSFWWCWHCIRHWLWLTNRFTMISSFRFSHWFSIYPARLLCMRYSLQATGVRRWLNIRFANVSASGRSTLRWQTNFDYSVGMPNSRISNALLFAQCGSSGFRLHSQAHKHTFTLTTICNKSKIRRSSSSSSLAVAVGRVGCREFLHLSQMK